MWNDWLEKGKNLAEKAKEAAAGLENQLNESVGLTTEAANSGNVENYEEDFGDPFYDDDDLGELSTDVDVYEDDYEPGQGGSDAERHLSVEKEKRQLIDGVENENDPEYLTSTNDVSTFQVGNPTIPSNKESQDGPFSHEGLNGIVRDTAEGENKSAEKIEDYTHKQTSIEGPEEVLQSQSVEKDPRDGSDAEESHIHNPQYEEPSSNISEFPVNNLQSLDAETQDLSKNVFDQESRADGDGSSHNTSNEKLISLKSEISRLQKLLASRESQLQAQASKLVNLQTMHETEKESLQQKIRDTKDEAKKRIQRAKEHVENLSSTEKKKDDIIEELRREGTELAKNQGETEVMLRQARAEVRHLSETLEEVSEERDVLRQSLNESLSSEKKLREEVSSLQKGNARVDELSSKLFSEKESTQKLQATVTKLEMSIKDLKVSHAEDLEALKKNSDVSLQELTDEQRQLKKLQSEYLKDMETKMRVTEREANVREDALRHEIEELRKRWQDSVRRADALSMDVQESTAPLIRQLESAERQNRLRASTWAEVENKLRTELENTVIENDSLQQQTSQLTADVKLLRKQKADFEEKTNILKEELNLSSERVEQLCAELSRTQQNLNQTKLETETLVAKAHDATAKVRQDLMETIMSNEQQFKVDMDDITQKLRDEREKRFDLEEQLEHVMRMEEQGGAMMNNGHSSTGKNPKELVDVTNQATILESTLIGLQEFDDDLWGDSAKTATTVTADSSVTSSFAAMEQLSQALRASKFELEALQKRLDLSEQTRESLRQELLKTKKTADKLPLFEKKVKDLTLELQEKHMDLQSLRENITEIKEMYRSQLDVLLEEKAANTPLPVPPPSEEMATNESGKYSTPSDVAAAAFDIPYEGDTH